MSPSATPALPIEREHTRLIAATAAVLLVGWLGDFLFWRHEVGLSVGLFAAVIALGMWVAGRRSVPGGIILAALLVSAAQSVIEVCFTNVACLGAFLILLLAETQFDGFARGWPRWSEALVYTLFAPFRWFGFVGAWSEVRTVAASHGLNSPVTLGRLLTASLPAIGVTLAFTCLLGMGNAVFADLLRRMSNLAWHWIADISFARTLLWIVWLTLGLAFFWPPRGLVRQRFWTRPIPHWNRSETTFAQWQSGLLLLAVNAVFFAANSADVLYLWARAEIPGGVSPSRFLHEGVAALIVATVLAGLVLAVVFNQQTEISGSKILRALGLLWIAQNLLLIAGVFRRLELYVEAFQLSELRVYVGCFLLVVSIGFFLLGRNVWRGMNLGRLILGNVASVLGLFFVLQFCDVGTWVGQWNVERWREGKHTTVDLNYLVELRSRGWPALAEIAVQEKDPGMQMRAHVALADLSEAERRLRENRDWRSFQWRRDQRFESILIPLSKTNP